MKIIAGTTSQFQNIPKLRALLKKSVKKASQIVRDIELISDVNHIKTREIQYTTDDHKPYMKMTNEIYIYTVVDGYSCYVSHGDTQPILWLDLLPKDFDVNKISRNLIGSSNNIPDNVWVHEAYHLIAGAKGEELKDYPSVEDLCKNKEEVIATYMEILYLEEQGYKNDEIVKIIDIFNGKQSKMDMFFKLTSKYRI